MDIRELGNLSHCKSKMNSGRKERAARYGFSHHLDFLHPPLIPQIQRYRAAEDTLGFSKLDQYKNHERYLHHCDKGRWKRMYPENWLDLDCSTWFRSPRQLDRRVHNRDC